MVPLTYNKRFLVRLEKLNKMKIVSRELVKLFSAFSSLGLSSKVPTYLVAFPHQLNHEKNGFKLRPSLWKAPGLSAMYVG